MSDKLGALWIKEERFSDRSPVMTGVLDIDGKSIKVVVFKNESKLSERSPDYSILRAMEPKKVDGAAAAREYAKKVNKEEDDIPFN